MLQIFCCELSSIVTLFIGFLANSYEVTQYTLDHVVPGSSPDL